MRYQVNTDHIRDALKTLRVGDQGLLSGTVYTARDAAHKQIFELLDRGEEPPFPLKDAILYYAGPTPARGNMPVGACGPTTAGRMDEINPCRMLCGCPARVIFAPRAEPGLGLPGVYGNPGKWLSHGLDANL